MTGGSGCLIRGDLGARVSPGLISEGRAPIWTSEACA